VRPTVDCSTAPLPAELVPDRDGESTEVGSLLQEGTVVITQSVSLGHALSLVEDGYRRSIAIVDDDHVMVGVVHDVAAPTRSRRRSRGAVAATMSSVIAIDERTPVRVALRLLAASHLREATVVSKEGVPIGVFRDVDGLLWIARAKV
jgi:predicted transcriptional regulator